ncbi:MAG: STAS/SEC14 domain-containing protein [gamma proteobacterium symbiont of Bathyaustriella thionipta]|nr:STAS/SEC14 domain-containing protein [gamma proteobacterium symbiont of Bathyaustriella thionipta]MCU7951624.1 STAS/SEC14 domain-containing protein [gamma proteobacterium symbiont of Bathyaustriella thionipta]MCU7952827.1 STAS/SEC14 domain-containing protein [gamma proteobacterium symbiont of Bathyaustriella thionipta]MCU7958214.1 STAS/SEC14 domain-containing protein [gamma proteobacterium symbiont of Bathyaustriella thionipta]
MTINRNGLSIGIERIDSSFFMTLKAIGKLTHEDYEMIAPMIDSAIDGVKNAKIKILVDGTEMEGWEPRAAWDDFKLGIRHGKEFEKIAIYGNKNWQEIAAKIGSWFVSGEIKYFENYNNAVQWIGTSK